MLLETRESKDGSGGGGGRGQKQKPYHTVSGIPYADVRQRVPLPDWYYTKCKSTFKTIFMYNAR